PLEPPVSPLDDPPAPGVPPVVVDPWPVPLVVGRTIMRVPPAPPPTASGDSSPAVTTPVQAASNNKATAGDHREIGNSVMKMSSRPKCSLLPILPRRQRAL